MLEFLLIVVACAIGVYATYEYMTQFRTISLKSVLRRLDNGNDGDLNPGLTHEQIRSVYGDGVTVMAMFSEDGNEATLFVTLAGYQGTLQLHYEDGNLTRVYRLDGCAEHEIGEIDEVSQQAAKSLYSIFNPSQTNVQHDSSFEAPESGDVVLNSGDSSE